MADDLSDADIGLSDDDIGLGDAQSPPPATSQAQGMSDADIGLSDSDIGLDRPQAETPLKTFGREAAHGAAPAAGGLLAGAAAGAGVGAFTANPFGIAAGAIIGGLAGAYGTEKVQEAALDELGYDDSQQRAANAAENPKSAFAGQMAPALATMRPDRGATIAARGINAGLMGGIEAGQELYNDGEVSPGKVAASAVAGAVLPTPNRLGKPILGAGERLGTSIAAKVPGRPGRAANPAAVPEQAEVQQANDQPITTGEVSLQQSPPSVEGDTVGNPVSAPERSERQYGKGTGPTSEAPDMLTQGDFAPDVAQALQATTDPDTASVPRIAAEGTWLDEAAPSPKQQDFGYEGTKPIDTGIVEAAQANNVTTAPNGSVGGPADPTKPASVVFQPPAAQRPRGWKKGTEAWAEQPVAPAAPAPPPAAQQAIARSKAMANNVTTAPNGSVGGPADPTKPASVVFQPPAAQQAIARSKANANASKPTLGLKKSAMEKPRIVGDMEPADIEAAENGPPATVAEMDAANAKATPQDIIDEYYSAVGRGNHDDALALADADLKAYPNDPVLRKAHEVIAKNATLPPREQADHPVAKIAEAAKETNTSPSPAQIEADNYKKGGGRLFGREIKIENPQGSIRRSKPGVEPPWEVKMPADYGDIKGTKGADGDNIDILIPGTGDKHFIIDQRDADTGKFDEHKVIAHAKDAQDAVDHYVRGFSDERGLDRLGSIKEVSEGDLKAWLAKPGAKRTPFDPEFKSAAGPTEGEKPLPKVVTAAVTKMRERGLPEDAIARFMQLEPSKRLGEASKFVNESEKVSTRPDRIRTPAPTVEGLVNDEGKPVTARSKTDAANKSRDVKKMNDAYEAVKARMPETLPTTPEEKKALYENLQSFLNTTRDVKYRPNFKHAPYLLARAAKKLTLAKNPSEKGWTEFAEVMHQLRAGNETDVRQGQRIEADIGRSRRSGDDAIANAEAKSAGTNEVEDAMIRALDAKRGYIDVPHEEAEDFVKPQPVKSRADIKEPKGTIDITKPEGQEALAKALGSDVGETKKAATAKEEESQQAIMDASREKAAKSLGTTDKAALNAKYAALLETAQKKGKSHAAELDALPSDVKDLKPAAKDLFEHFLRDERASLNVDKMMGDVLDFFKGTASRLMPKSTPRPTLGAKASFAKTPTSMQHELQHSLSNELHQIRQQDIEDKIQALKLANSMPIDEKARERIYFAREAGKINSLSPEDRALYDQHLKPILDENDKLYDNIKAIDPSRVGPEVMDHISRITKGQTADRNILMSKESSDPVEGVNAISTAQKGPLKERRFVGLERQDGKRFVISLNDDGFQIWKDGKSQKVVDPTFKFEAGKSIKVGNNTFKMTEAMTPEIEAHAKMEGGAKAEYYHNAPLSALTTNTYLKAMARHLQYLHNLKSDPVFTKFAKPPGKAAPDGWVETKLKNFDGWKMDPQLAHVFDDFAQPGFNEDSLNSLRRLSQAVTKTIFWMPTAHINNVGTHWFVERGWNWLPGTGGYRSLAVNGAKAIKSVIAQDGLQSQLRENGAGTIYGGILTQGFMDQLGKAAGEMIRKNPSRWDPIARVMGVGPSTLADAVYKGASKVMWAANDMLLTHAVLENMDLHGMSMPDAIRNAERHIPNYRVPPELITGGKMGRILSQIMQEPTLTAFGRYHYGVFNSYAHMVKDLVKGDGAQRKEAIGNLFAMGLLAFAVYPALDKAWSTLTDNPDATAQRRGPTAIPHHLARAAQGKEDPMQAARSTVTTAPLLTNVWETLTNKDFRGKNIVEPGDFRQAAQGNLKAAGRVATQSAQHTLGGLVSPIGTFSKARPDEGPLGIVRDQALDIRNPSPQSRKYEANVPRTTTQQSRTRFKHPSGALEQGFNKTFGY